MSDLTRDDALNAANYLADEFGKPRGDHRIDINSDCGICKALGTLDAYLSHPDRPTTVAGSEPSSATGCPGEGIAINCTM